MTIVQAIVLGVVQGLGEFLPISSSAHLILMPWFFNWTDPGLGFDVALHWGTLLAVLMYFRQDIWLLIKGFWHSLFKSTSDFKENIYQKLSWFIIVASVPGVVLGKLLESKAETVFRTPLLLAITLAGFGVLLYLADRLGEKCKNLDRMTWKDSLLIGLSQALAVIPGVSRSGSTIAAGLGLKMKREDAARFSFLMSAPIIFGAGLVNVTHFSDGAALPQLIVGFLTATLFGFLSIKYLLRYLSKHGFGVFVWYRFLLALAIILVIYLR